LTLQDSNSDLSVVQPVTSRYTDYAIPAPINSVYVECTELKIFFGLLLKSSAHQRNPVHGFHYINYVYDNFVKCLERK
jgi:hypothetical protein